MAMEKFKKGQEEEREERDKKVRVNPRVSSKLFDIMFNYEIIATPCPYRFNR